jgi:hypothetical protein
MEEQVLNYSCAPRQPHTPSFSPLHTPSSTPPLFLLSLDLAGRVAGKSEWPAAGALPPPFDPKPVQQANGNLEKDGDADLGGRVVDLCVWQERRRRLHVARIQSDGRAGPRSSSGGATTLSNDSCGPQPRAAAIGVDL